jgi:hypothetical protein
MTIIAGRSKQVPSRFTRSLRGLAVLASFAAATMASANPRQSAIDLHMRLNAGVLPTAEKLAEMEQLIKDGKPQEAALAAINDSRGYFYNVVLRDRFGKMSVNDRAVFDPTAPINDMTATMIGMVRDDKPFSTVLSADIVYVNGSAPPAGQTNAAYSLANNTHYSQMHQRDLPLHTALVERQQSDAGVGLPASGVAGVMSLRGWAAAYYSAGTNRRPFKAVLENFLGEPIEKFKDTTVSDALVRKDVPRSPGGNSTDFVNNCKGCHAGMDAFASAFCFYDYSAAGAVVFTPGVVQAKCLNVAPLDKDCAVEFPRPVEDAERRAACFAEQAKNPPVGVTPADDSWRNMWAEAGSQNSFVGWPAVRSGKGAKSFGEMIGQTQAFADAMARIALEIGCKVQDPKADGYKPLVAEIANEFKADGKYSFKSAVANAAARCTPKASS